MIEWTQESEMKWLEGIGTWGVNAPASGLASDVPAERRIGLLLGYLKAMETPRRWFPGVDIARLESMAKDLLEQEYIRLAEWEESDSK